MTHGEMMYWAWRFIKEVGITENEAELLKNPETNILVDDIYKVRDAFYNDLKYGYVDEDEDVYGFLDRHEIEWQ